MKTWTIQASIFCLLPAALPVFSGQPKGALAPIALYNEFERDPPAPVKTALRDELASIMTPLGLRFEWRDLRGPRQKPAIELAVISFKGRCDAAGLLPRQGDSSGALGWTHISDGVILPFSDVDCDGIRRFLQPALLTVSSASREGAFGRAVARVLAHELYHIFADTTRHGSCGIGKEAYTVKDLLASGFRFEDQESKALKNGKAYALLAKGFEPPD